MKDILHSVYLKLDPGIQSLTRRALSQVCLKIIFNESSRGIGFNSIKQRIHEYSGIEVRNKDLQDALQHLQNRDGQINLVRGKYFIGEKTRLSLQSTVDKSKREQREVLLFWFGESETIKVHQNFDVIEVWFQYIMVQYFKNYKYDWLIEFKQGKNGRKRELPKIDQIITNSFEEYSSIPTSDKIWLKGQIIYFLESNRPEDQLLHWTYGASAFSSALITANNYADRFSLESFKDSIFILDTNVLMILGLEGFQHIKALKKIESIFDKLNIQPIYFDISKSEYRNALAAKKNAVISSLDKFGIEVLKNADCPYVATALMRQVTDKEGFDTFFNQIEDVQSFFSEKVPIELEDDSEIDDAIEVAKIDESVQDKINKIYKNKTGRNKRERALMHDAGILGGAEFLRTKNKKVWILTRDSILKSYAFEYRLRDDLPIAVGLDSFIQLMAADAGGADIEASDFAPIFSKIVQADLILDREVYSPDDLYLLLESKIEIEKLGDDKVMEIARGVNKFRFSGADEKDIALMIRKSFNSSVDDMKKQAERFSQEAYQYKNKLIEQNREAEKYKEKGIEAIYREKLMRLRNRVLTNWGLMFILGTIFFIITFLISKYPLDKNTTISIVASLFLAFVLDTILSKIFSLKLWVRKLDKASIRSEAECEIDKQ